MQTLNLILLIVATIAFAFVLWMDARTHTVEHWPIAVLATLAIVKIAANGEWLNLVTIVLPAILFLISIKRDEIGGADLKVIAVTGLFYGFMSELVIMVAACVLGMTVSMLIHRQPKQAGTKRAKTTLCAWIGLSAILFNGYALIASA